MKKLKQEFGFEDKSALWASLSWAIGLGNVKEDEYIDIVNHISNSKESGELNYFNNITKKNVIMEKKYTETEYKFGELDWNTKGLALHNQGNYKEAIECYNKALSIDPSNEFLIKRINQSKEIIQRNNSKFYQNKDQRYLNKIQSYPPINNSSRSLLHMAIFAIILTSIGTAAVIYILIWDKDINSKLLSNEIESKANSKTWNLTNDTSKTASDSGLKVSKNHSISEFTKNIKSEIGNGEQLRANENLSLSSNSEVLYDLPIALTQLSPESADEYNQTGQDQSNQFHNQNKQLDLFKTELAKAMNTTFS